jgi:hypothetical protein
MKWSEFIENPKNSKEPQKGVMMIILQRDIRPQPVFSLLLTGQSFDPADYGYAMTDGKVQREGSVYLSSDMVKLKCWCDQYDISYSFSHAGENEYSPFLDGEYLQLCGDFTMQAIETFPLKYLFMNIRGES